MTKYPAFYTDLRKIFFLFTCLKVQVVISLYKVFSLLTLNSLAVGIRDLKHRIKRSENHLNTYTHAKTETDFQRDSEMLQNEI